MDLNFVLASAASVSVYSTMTIASAPRGTIPPVAIKVVDPCVTANRGSTPGVSTSAFSCRILGACSLALSMSPAQTAKTVDAGTVEARHIDLGHHQFSQDPVQALRERDLSLASGRILR